MKTSSRARTRALIALFSSAVLTMPRMSADDVTALPAVANLTLATVGAHPTFDGRNDGFGSNSDLLDATFVIDIDFDNKSSGERETIFETGAGTVGTSFVYETPNTLVVRSVGNGGFDLVTVSYLVPQATVDAGEVEVGFAIDVDNGAGEQGLSIIVDGAVVASESGVTGGDWSGGDGARLGAAGGVTGNGGNATIPAIAFTSGTLNLVNGLRFYANTRWVPLGNDSDMDGLPDWWEEVFAPGDLTVLATGGDADVDGLNDEAEFAAGTNPTLMDSDTDGLTDGVEADPTEPGYTATNVLVADTDGDGRTDGEEVNGAPSTDPLVRDTDMDGVTDGVEVANGSDPNSAASRPDLGVFLAARYALDGLGAGMEAPDAFSSLHLYGANFDPAAAAVTGMDGDAVNFDAAIETMLSRVSAAGERLPVSQHPDHTIAMWVKVAGAGQNDLRLFSEATQTEDNTLYNIGTHNGGADGTLDIFLRSAGGTNAGHQRSTVSPLDDTWHHIAWVRSGDTATLYVDGVADATAFTWLDPFSAAVNVTSLGGIQRAKKSHWVTGAIDEVSLWEVALTAGDVAALFAADNALGIIDDTDGDGLPDVWEERFGLDPDNAADAGVDGDSDTLTNLQEFALGIDPTMADTDGDTLRDDVETDDGVWTSAGATGTSPRSADTDRDGLRDDVEVPNLAFDPNDPAGQPGSDPALFDTDGDGVSDGSEVASQADPTDPNTSPMVDATGVWCADDEPLGTGYGGDGWLWGPAGAPAGGILNPLNGPEAIAISAEGAAQTGLAQTVDFSANAQFDIAATPDSLNELFGVATISADATLELTFSPDSASGGHQFLWESGGTGDGQGLVLIDSTVYVGVNDGNGAPYGGAVVGIDIAPLYGPGGFDENDYLLVRAVFEVGKQVTLGVTHMGTGLSASDRVEWLGDRWDGGDRLGLGRWSVGRGGDRGNQLSNLPGATVTWPGFEGQIAKFAFYPAPLAATIVVGEAPFRITDISIDFDTDEVTLVWDSQPGEIYSVFGSVDAEDWTTEIDDNVPSGGESTSLVFELPIPGAPAWIFRVER